MNYDLLHAHPSPIQVNSYFKSTNWYQTHKEGYLTVTAKVEGEEVPVTHFFIPRNLVKTTKHILSLEKQNSECDPIFEIIGISFINLTWIYIRTAYGLKVIIHFNEHESIPISKLMLNKYF